MGSDDLHKKRKSQTLKQKQRKIGTKKPYDRVLIVCEGSKTEPLYFKALREEYQLHTANIEICNSSGSDPISIVNHAKIRYREAKNERNSFDRVYCVFDKDQHANYKPAIKTLESLAPKNTFFAITSIPCFEYWILLHFSYTTRPYVATHRKSAADSVISELKKYIPHYEKNVNIFDMIKGSTSFAITNAKKANESAQRGSTDNPSTKIVYLVEDLINLLECK
ncbi:CRISPR-associated protein [Vespertiliibacter pulmonis]|uniref:RloB-like protein n=1 Tax=Vespertiliibacter pulmonis TaxID=1443036 RepID=A0A3N4VSK1_9PAST|nr:RloB family protein [Vespertiliibacter pulmonis]QLB20048.1 CRISPR-associated protein [Vespertiliibacter pulmonis]QLB20114.1 CRISPR-associated protein [Vespertiliibacter pulmonis]RPE86082.1 RloB-like protein [Vespertiliibacter pulmonis]